MATFRRSSTELARHMAMTPVIYRRFVLLYFFFFFFFFFLFLGGMENFVIVLFCFGFLGGISALSIVCRGMNLWSFYRLVIGNFA